MADVTDTSKDTGKRTIQFRTKGLKAFEDECAKIKLPIIETWKIFEKLILQVPKTDRNIEQYQKLHSEIETQCLTTSR